MYILDRKITQYLTYGKIQGAIKSTQSGVLLPIGGIFLSGATLGAKESCVGIDLVLCNVLAGCDGTPLDRWSYRLFGKQVH